MIVVDTSVWIDVLRKSDSDAVRTFRTLAATRTVLVLDIILFELVQGVRSERERTGLLAALSAFPVNNAVGPELAIAAADRNRVLRTRGITIRSAIDVLIASFCLRQDLPLLQQDRDFQPFASHFGLRLL